jgi:glycosyltransferase involved in cell wall biosynthesis
MPGYNAAATLEQTCQAIQPGAVDDVILVDDESRDNTVEIARAWASGSSCTRRIADTERIRRPATMRPCSGGRTSS